jgi:hypothetical protein
MLIAFDQKLDDYVGAPRVTAFALSASDLQGLKLAKLFDQDCATTSRVEAVACFRAMFAGQSGSNTCVFTLLRGELRDQHSGQPVLVPLRVACTGVVEFEANSMNELLTTGELSGDPPVLSGSLRQLVWTSADRTVALTAQFEILVEQASLEITFINDGNGWPIGGTFSAVDARSSS